MSFDYYKNIIAQEQVAIQFSKRLKSALATLPWTKQAPDTSPLRGMYQQWEWELGQALLDHWDGQSASLIDELMASTLAGTASKGERLLGNDKWWAGWAGAYAALLIPFMESGAGTSEALALDTFLADYALGVDADATNAVVADWARRYAGKLAKGLTNTDRERLGQGLAAWAESGEDFSALVKRIEEIVGNRGRAEMIAATEATTCYAQGNYAVWKESGIVTGRVWNTAVDERVCPICRELDGQIAAIDDNIWHTADGSVGYGPGPPMEPAHVRCRCFTSPYTGPLPWESE